MDFYEEEEYTESKFDFLVWKKIFGHMKPLKKHLIIGMSAAIGLAIIDTLYPLINKYAIDEMVETGSIDKLPFFIGFYVVVMFSIMILVYTFIMHAGQIQQKLSYILRKKAFKRLQELPFSYYDRTPVGWIMARMTSDSRRLSDILSWGLIDLSWGLLTMVGITIVVLVINWQLGLILIGMLPIIMLLSIYFRRRILRSYRHIRKENSKITGSFNEGITGAKTTKALVLEDRNFQDFDRLTSSMRRHSIRAAMFAGLYFPSILFVASIATGLIMYYAGYEASIYDKIAGIGITVGTLYVYINYVGQFFEPVMQLANILARFQQAQASGERIMDLIEQKPEIWDRPEVIEKYGDAINFKRENWEELKGEVEFNDVTFKYNKGETVLSNFNLKVKQGESIALVGHTGAGKSTIVNLICRFYEPTGGKIIIDGKDYKDRSLGWLHDNLGYVLQSPHLFSGTIMDNIRYGNTELSEYEVYKAAKLVEADDFIREFEDGYDTQVGEGGARLSVGQKQLVSFARALLANPKILILDEATSSVDTHTEKSIQRAIDTVLAGRTSFVIAHRLSTITSCDRILVLEDGKIIEQGNHKELIKLEGHYYKLYTNQFKSKAIEDSKNG